MYCLSNFPTLFSNKLNLFCQHLLNYVMFYWARTKVKFVPSESFCKFNRYNNISV